MLRSVLIASVLMAFGGQAAFAVDSMDCCSEGGGCATKDKNGKTVSAGTMYQIKFTQSGGIAGMHRELLCDTANLKKNQQGRIGELVAATGIMKTEQVRKTTPGAADMFQYTFEITCCGKTHKATYDEGTLPDRYAALRSYLNEVPTTVPAPPVVKKTESVTTETKVEESKPGEIKVDETKTEETKVENALPESKSEVEKTTEIKKEQKEVDEGKLDTRE